LANLDKRKWPLGLGFYAKFYEKLINTFFQKIILASGQPPNARHQGISTVQYTKQKTHKAAPAPTPTPNPKAQASGSLT
jgi:hypothetical protein